MSKLLQRVMKIAITSTGDPTESMLDQRFGRCIFFAFYDTESREIEFLPNPNRDAAEGAGPASVQIVASRKVSRIISGDFGVKIRSLLESLNIEMVALKEPDKTIKEIIMMIDNN